MANARLILLAPELKGSSVTGPRSTALRNAIEPGMGRGTRQWSWVLNIRPVASGNPISVETSHDRACGPDATGIMVQLVWVASWSRRSAGPSLRTMVLPHLGDADARGTQKLGNPMVSERRNPCSNPST